MQRAVIYGTTTSRRIGKPEPDSRSSGAGNHFLCRSGCGILPACHPANIAKGDLLMGKLEGKVALVTGSGRNIGRATVLKLAGEGAHVVVNARSNQGEAESVAREARELGVKAISIVADVANKDQVDGM